jgi:MFS family permease
MSSEPSKPSLKDTLTVVGCMTVMQAHGSMAALWLPSIAPEVAADVGVSPSLIGYQVTILYVGAMIMSLMIGGLIRRWGAWRTCQASLFLFSAAHLCLMTGSLAMMLVGSVVLGFAYGMINPPASHLLAKVATPANRNFVFSVRFTGVPLGGILTSLVAPKLAIGMGWQASMLVTAVAGLVLFVALQPFRARWDSDRVPSSPLWRDPRTDAREALANPILRWLCAVGLFFAGIQIALTAFTVTMLVEEVGYALVTAAYALTAVQIAGVTGRVGWGLVADRLRDGFLVLLVIALISAGSAVVAASIDADWSTWLVYGLFFVFGFSAMGWNGVFASAVADASPPGKIGNMAGATFFFTFSGVITGPLVFSALFALTGRYTVAYWVMAVLALLAALAIITARRAWKSG